MSGICLPIDAVSGSPVFPAAQNRVAFGALMTGRADRPLGAVSGVRPGSDPGVTVTATDATVTPFTAILDPETALTVGAYLVAFEADEVVTINAADATHSRVDRLDVQCPDDPAGASPLSAQIVYTAGVADGSDTVPAAPVRSFPLGTISVPAAGGGSPSFTSTLVYSVASGGVLPCVNSTRYPANPFVGQLIYDLSTDEVKRWTGTDWRLPKGTAYRGSHSGSATSGMDTIAHGLGFAPSQVQVVSTIHTIGTQNPGILSVENITSTSFDVYFWGGVGTGSDSFYVKTDRSGNYAINWVAYE